MYMITKCSEFFESSTHMFQHDRHEYTRATSLTFPYIAVVFEVPLLRLAECMGQRKNRMVQ